MLQVKPVEPFYILQLLVKNLSNIFFFKLRVSFVLGMVDSPECANLILQSGANINAQDQRGNTPAMVACFFNKPNILKALIQAKADLTLKNNEGKDVKALADDEDLDECKAVLQ